MKRKINVVPLLSRQEADRFAIIEYKHIMDFVKTFDVEKHALFHSPEFFEPEINFLFKLNCFQNSWDYLNKDVAAIILEYAEIFYEAPMTPLRRELRQLIVKSLLKKLVVEFLKDNIITINEKIKYSLTQGRSRASVSFSYASCKTHFVYHWLKNVSAQHDLYAKLLQEMISPLYGELHVYSCVIPPNWDSKRSINITITF